MKTILEGMAMGFCDIIPGISGGTIALITGIYERLMTGIKSYTPRNILKLDKSLDIMFFVKLVMGIIIGVGIGAVTLPHFLINFNSQTLYFFIGLILASAYLMYKHFKVQKLYVLFGLILGILVSYLVPVNPGHSLPIIFVSGMLAICAMFLPGISGSYILLILGQYEHILHSLKSLVLTEIVVFLIGCIIGVVVISRIISWLLKNWHDRTLSTLLGLIIGALMVPINQVNGFSGWYMIIIGLIIVIGLNKISVVFQK